MPTHCYDYEKIYGKFSFESSLVNSEFETVLDTKIQLTGTNSYFKIDNDNFQTIITTTDSLNVEKSGLILEKPGIKTYKLNL